jgi:hypothetical protein
VFVTHWTGFVYNNDCELVDRGLPGLPKPGSVPVPRDLGDVSRFYDPAQPMPTRGNCPR